MCAKVVFELVKTLEVILTERPDPNEQMFWIYPPGGEHSKFLLKRFNAHYNSWFRKLEKALKDGD